MKVDKNIFRESDIRGVASGDHDAKAIEEYEKWYGEFQGVSINLEVAEGVGKAYGSYIRKSGGSKVVVGYEKRPSSKRLCKQFMKGVVSTGISVDFVGVCLTPLIYFATSHCGYDGGVNVTGSHNVYFFNGFKLVLDGSSPLYGEELQDLRRAVEGEDFVDVEVVGEIRKRKVFDKYVQFVSKRVEIRRGLKVVVDAGNGSAGVFAPKLLRKVGCEVEEIYTKVDTHFPNHVPDPSMPQHMEDLGEKVVECGADLGIGFDADGDRVGFVDEKGDFIKTDDVLMVLIKCVLANHQGDKVLFDVKSSEYLFDVIESHGGVALMHKAGHAPIKDTMRKDEEIVFGGEMSGHYYWREFYKVDDGMYTALKMLEILSNRGGVFSDLFTDLPKRIATPEIKLPCLDSEKFEVVEKIKDKMIGRFEKVITIDGMRFYTDDYCWGLVRASNTSPYLTIRVEADSDEKVMEIKNMIADELEKHSEVKDKLNRDEVASLTGRLGWI